MAEQNGVKHLKCFYMVLTGVTFLAGFVILISYSHGQSAGTGDIVPFEQRSKVDKLDTVRDKGVNKVAGKEQVNPNKDLHLAPLLEEKRKELHYLTSHDPLVSTIQPEVSKAQGSKDLTPLAKEIQDVTSVTKGSKYLTNEARESEGAVSLDPDEPIWGATSTGLRKLPWTSLYGKHEKDSFHFFSAYYDDRVSAPGRPAVLVMGYSYNAVYKQNVKFYCVFKYRNGSTICRRTPTTDRHPNTCLMPSLGGKPRHYICGMKDNEESPAYVRLSNSSGCEPQFTSGEIPVRNRHHAEPTKKFGVCITGPLIQESRGILQNLIQFIELSQLMGAEFIIMYANDTQIDKDILEYLWTHYPGVVRTIGWKWFEKWHPLHYFGQLLIMSDCLYQVMYEVENVAMMDIDEMIVPVKHNNWDEMIRSFRVSQSTTAFRFQNAFFDDPNPSATVKQQAEIKTENPTRFVPKYFTHTRRYRCNPYTDYRTKVIAHPRFVVEPAIHSVCKAVADHEVTYRVPQDVGFLAHYRDAIPEECKRRPTYTDRVLDKFKDKLNRRILG